jgi:hypothetical protein
MSTGTKSLRTILMHYQQLTGPGLVPRPIPLEAAIEEIEAIERAAPVALAAFTGDIHVFKSDRLNQCVATLESIAKETT